MAATAHTRRDATIAETTPPASAFGGGYRMMPNARSGTPSRRSYRRLRLVLTTVLRLPLRSAGSAEDMPVALAVAS
jgi:hypothetical protein